MSGKAIADMETLMQLKFQRKQRIFAKVLAEEARLRGQIRMLDDQAREAESSADHRVRALGVDLSWTVWLERKKASLNRDLAQVLAQKDQLAASVRKEFGKVIVSQKLNEEEVVRTTAKQQQRRLDEAIQSHFHIAGKHQLPDQD